jgi:hypothetical protein
MEALRKKERQDEDHSLPPKLMVFWMSLNAYVLICSFFKNLTLCMTKLRVLVLCSHYFTDNSIILLTKRKLWENFRNISFKYMGRAGPKKVMLFDSIQIWHPMSPSLPPT